MPTLERVTDASSALFEGLWSIYESSFPSDERRSLEKQAPLFDDKRYYMLAAVEDGRAIGVISYWDLDDFSFIEHIAVHESSRGTGAGTRMMEEFLKGRGKVILEVEAPRTPMQKKRVAFYERLGFLLNSYDYIQPPYGEGKKPVHLLLMSRPARLAEEEFSSARKELHSSVYGLMEPMV